MNYRNMSEAAALGAATNIKMAIWSDDRNMMACLDRRYNGIKSITRLLVAAGFMTASERRDALCTMPNINNPSCRS